jgi:hypothetical protein
MLSLLNPVSEPDGWARFYADMRFAFGANLMLGGRDFVKPVLYGGGKGEDKDGNGKKRF